VSIDQRLRPYFVELGLDPEIPAPASSIPSFGELPIILAPMAGSGTAALAIAVGVHCDLVAELEPEIVSFHFGLPSEDLLNRVKATGAKILSSATTS
jgi:nitronate monooxygenase